MIELSCTAHYHCTQIKIIIAWCARGAHLQLRYTVAAQIYCFQFNCVLICAPFREIKKISYLWVFYLSSSLITILLKTHISNNINRVTEVFCLHTSQYYISDPSLDSEWTVINNQQHSQHSYMLSRYKILGFISAIFNSGLYVDSDSSILIYSKVSSYICSFIAHFISSQTIDFRQPHEPINTILISLSFSRLIALITSPVNARTHVLHYTLHTILQSSRAVFPELYLVT